MQHTATLPTSIRPRGVLATALIKQMHVFHALVLHDIKSRFFGTGLGYIVTILWPAAHVAVIVAIFLYTGRQAPYGDDNFLYASLGVLPYIMWNYISRFTMLGIMQNKSFLQYPAVKPLDMIFARQALEIVSCTIITVGLFIVLELSHVDAMPHRLIDAALALFSAVLLGVGFGVLGGVITMIYPLFNAIYVGILILFWVTSGVAINPEAMPESIGAMLAWNPLLHSIEWLRLAYYDDYPAHLLSKAYVLYLGAGALALGLVLERALRFLTTR